MKSHDRSIHTKIQSLKSEPRPHPSTIETLKFCFVPVKSKTQSSNTLIFPHTIWANRMRRCSLKSIRRPLWPSIWPPCKWKPTLSEMPMGIGLCGKPTGSRSCENFLASEFTLSCDWEIDRRTVNQSWLCRAECCSEGFVVTDFPAVFRLLKFVYLYWRCWFAGMNCYRLKFWATDKMNLCHNTIVQ